MRTKTPDRILDAALVAFATRGVDGTTITHLEAAAGLAEGSGGFYRYYRTKDEVLAALVRREIDRAVEASSNRDRVLPTEPRAAVTVVLTGILEDLQSMAPLMAVLAREHGRIPQLAEEMSDQLIGGGLRNDAVELAAALGDSDIDRLRQTGVVVLCALVGYQLATTFFDGPPGAVESTEFIDALSAMVVARHQHPG